MFGSEKYKQSTETNPINGKDEELIKIGIERHDTESVTSSTKSHKELEEETAATPLDDSSFAPGRVFYILRHNLFTKEVKTIDLTGKVSATYVSPNYVSLFPPYAC
jgi:hypothetical protein